MKFKWLNTFKETISSDKEISGNIKWLFVIQLLTYLFPAIITPVLIRKVGIENYGYFSLSFSLCFYLQLIIDFGFNNSSIREVVENKNDSQKLRQIFFKVLYSKIIIGIILFIPLLVLGFVIKNQIVYDNLFYLFFYFLSSSLMPIWFYQGLSNLSFLSVLTLASKILVFILIIFLIKSPKDSILISIIFSAAQCLTTIGILLFTAIKYKWNFLLVRFADLVIEYRKALPFFYSTIFMSVLGSINVIIVGFVFNARIIGFYAAADKIIQGLRMLYAPVTRAVFPPTIAKYLLSGSEGYKFLKKTSKIFSPIIFGVSLLIMFNAPMIAKYFANTNDETFISLLRILAIIPLITFNGSLYSVNGLTSIRKEKVQAKIFGIITPIYILIQLTLGQQNIYWFAVNIIIVELVILLISRRVVQNYSLTKIIAHA